MSGGCLSMISTDNLHPYCPLLGNGNCVLFVGAGSSPLRYPIHIAQTRHKLLFCAPQAMRITDIQLRLLVTRAETAMVHKSHCTTLHLDLDFVQQSPVKRGLGLRADRIRSCYKS